MSKQRLISLWIYILFIALYGGCVKPLVPVIASTYLSPTKTIIVVPENYDESCRFLYKWLNIISGTEQLSNKHFTVAREYSEFNIVDTAGFTIVSVGNTFLNYGDTSLGNASFVIKRIGNLISIKGADQFGDYAGVNYFLDHYCGVRFYLPGDLFTSRQVSDSIFIPDSINVSETPDIKNVNSTGFNYNAYGSGDDILQWGSYWALIAGLTRNYIPEHEHTFSERFYDSTIIKDYPLIFSQGYVPTSSQDENFTPDFSEPELLDAAEYATIKYFKSNPTSPSIAFSVMDGTFKIGSATQAYIANYTDKSVGAANANILWLNDLATRMRSDSLGDKTIVYLVYSGLNTTPTIPLDSMILPVLVYQVGELAGDSLMYYYQHNIDIPLVDSWKEVTKRIGEHDWAEGMDYIYPRIYSDAVQDFCKLMQSVGGVDFYDIEAYPNWGLDGPKLYEMSKIFWNTNINVDSIRELFCNDMFGRSAFLMNAYFDELESLDTTNLSQSHLGVYTQQLTTDSTIMKELNGNLNDALSMDTSNLIQQRINFFKTGFNIWYGAWQIYNNNVDTSNYSNFLRSIAGHGDLFYLAGDSVTFLNNIPNFIKSL